MLGRCALWGGAVAAIAAVSLAGSLRAQRGAAPTVRPAGATPSPSVLLVTIDTLRTDRVGAYGATSPGTPVLDQLAREGALFERATVDVPLTRPSHTSLLTGKHPFQHGVRDNVSFPLAAGHRTLAETLRLHGYSTGAFVGAFVVGRQSGLDRGFDEFDDDVGTGAAESSLLGDQQRRAGEVEARAGAWIERAAVGRKPFFAWVHFYDPHSPYAPPPPFAARYATRPYDGEVAYTDSVLGRLLGRLTRLGVASRTLVVVTSDHGEGLGEHGEAEHGFFVYDTTVRVPLILRWPGTIPAAQRLQVQARSVDVLPTILDLLGAGDQPEGLAGRSLAPALRKPSAALTDSASYAETLFPRLHFTCAELRSITLGGWKYIEAPRPELFDLARDPAERENLFAREGVRARALRSRLLDVLGGTLEAPIVAGRAAPLSPDDIRRLASLGYVSAGGGASPGTDPKDGIADFQSYTRRVRGAFEAYDRGDLRSAIAQFQAAIATGRAAFDVHYYLGAACLRLARPGEAVVALRDAIRLLPTYAPAYLELARAHEAEGNAAAAAAAVREGLALAPGYAPFHAYLGFLARSRRDLATARTEYETARTLDPRDFDARMSLAALYRDGGDVTRALAEVEAALLLRPSDADAHNQRGMLLGATGRFADAATAFERATSLAAGNAQTWFNLGLARYRAGDRAGAAVALRRSLSLAPGFGEARTLLVEVEKGSGRR
jgi:choline-sulfatase